MISPALLQDELPVSDEIQTLVERSRTEIADVLHGRDDRLIIVVGPCSIHDHGQAMQYARLLRAPPPTSIARICSSSCACTSKSPHHRGLEGLHQ